MEEWWRASELSAWLFCDCVGDELVGCLMEYQHIVWSISHGLAGVGAKIVLLLAFMVSSRRLGPAFIV